MYLNNIEYKTFKYFINRYYNYLSQEFSLDILLLLKPDNYISRNTLNIEKNNIGIICIKIENFLNKLGEEVDYLKSELMLLFKMIWNKS